LRLWGLKSVTPEVAAAFVAHDGARLELNGIKELSPAAARALAKGRRSSGISVGLIDLPLKIAAILAEFPHHLDFPYLETLSLESAKAIAEHGEVVQIGSETVGPTLDLGKARLTPAIAEALLAHDGPLSLNRLKRLEPGVGDILAKHRFPVLLMLEEIDSVALARKIFSDGHSSSSVARLRTMSPEIAKEYARLDPGAILALETLTPEAATALGKVSDRITLRGVTHLTPELARALADRRPPVYLLGIKTLGGPDVERDERPVVAKREPATGQGRQRPERTRQRPRPGENLGALATVSKQHHLAIGLHRQERAAARDQRAITESVSKADSTNTANHSLVNHGEIRSRTEFRADTGVSRGNDRHRCRRGA